MEEDKFAYKSEVLFFNLRNCVSHSVVSDFVTSWTVACQAPLSMEFFRQEYWSGWACPYPGDLPKPRNRTWVSCVAGRFFTV